MLAVHGVLPAPSRSSELSPGRPNAVARSVRLADMNLPVPANARRIEIVRNGLPLWHEAQLAVDTTRVSPVTHARHSLASASRGGRLTRLGLALQLARRRERRDTASSCRARRAASCGVHC